MSVWYELIKSVSSATSKEHNYIVLGLTTGISTNVIDRRKICSSCGIWRRRTRTRRTWMIFSAAKMHLLEWKTTRNQRGATFLLRTTHNGISTFGDIAEPGNDQGSKTPAAASRRGEELFNVPGGSKLSQWDSVNCCSFPNLFLRIMGNKGQCFINLETIVFYCTCIPLNSASPNPFHIYCMEQIYILFI